MRSGRWKRSEPGHDERDRRIQGCGNLPGGGAGAAVTGLTAEAALEFATPNYAATPITPAKYPDLKDALLRFYPNGKLPSPGELGRLLRSMKECKFNGMHFAVYGTINHTIKWYVSGTPKE